MTELQQISNDIWDMKYRFQCPDTGEADRTIEDTWDRVAKALALCEGRHAARWQPDFRTILDDFRFLPAGRILS